MLIMSNTIEIKIFDLGFFDVLCGRGKQSYNNIGNRRFRIMININLQRYLKCETRPDRSKMICELTYDLQRSFRFLKHIKADGEKNRCSTLVVLDLTESRVKIAHALRDAAAQHKSMERKEISERKMPATGRNLVDCVDNNGTCNSDQRVYYDPPRVSIERKADIQLMAATSRNVFDQVNDNGKCNSDQRVCYDPSRLATSRNVVDQVNNNVRCYSEQRVCHDPPRLRSLHFQDEPAGVEGLLQTTELDLSDIFD